MTRDEWAAKLNGCEYGDEIDRKEAAKAKADGVLIVYGASDDLTEFAGAFNDEAGAYDGATHLITRKGLIPPHGDCDCDHCGYENFVKKASTIEALWCAEEGYSWTFATAIPHATFEVTEDDEPYCRGIVIDVKDIPE